MIGIQSITEVKGEQNSAEGSPEHTEEQEDTLIAPSFVFVEVQQPKLDVHHQEESSVQSGVEDGEAKLDGRRDSRMKWDGDRGRQGGGVGWRGSCDQSFHWGTVRVICPSLQRNCLTCSSQPEGFTSKT